MTAEAPIMSAMFGQLSADEYFVSEAASRAGITIRNDSRCEPMVILKHFGPNHLDIRPRSSVDSFTDVGRNPRGYAKSEPALALCAGLGCRVTPRDCVRLRYECPNTGCGT